MSLPSPMAGIPRIAHFVFGLRPQRLTFHPLHYAAIESCRQVVRPEKIVLHYHSLPFGALWEEIRPHLELVRVERPVEIDRARYDDRLVPEAYRYAHQADFVRLDALIEHGGLYADIDTIFLRPPPEHLWEESFVIGREPPVVDEHTGNVKPSLCNALLMAEPGSLFARTWRERMEGALDGSWSNHSGFLAQQLSEELPDEIHVEPEATFFPVRSTPEGIARLFAEEPLDTGEASSLHLWQHMWWEEDRVDFSTHHAEELTVTRIHRSSSGLARLLQPLVPTPHELAAGPR
ncbi:MAG: glycosyltransferase [Acidobacteriota bacterium]|nr:glycosyltransferase [Acidobacteriota bacterium]